METQIYDIVRTAAPVFLNPFVLAVPAIGAVGLVTGVAGRVAIRVEDLFHSRG